LHSSTGNSAPGSSGGAPIGSGIWILISLACSYGILIQMRNKEKSVAESGSTIVEPDVEINNTYNETKSLLTRSNEEKRSQKFISKFKIFGKIKSLHPTELNQHLRVKGRFRKNIYIKTA